MLKRLFDVLLSAIGLVLTGWIVILCWIIITLTARQNGLFIQKRIGQHGKHFKIYKIRTIYRNPNAFLNRTGEFLRKSKIDELPQLWNVLAGHMSMVGPRPDIPGYYDTLTGEDRELLKLRPGITGIASLKYSDEEKILSTKEDPKDYNDHVIFPDKIRINLEYQKRQSLMLDLKIILYTILRRNKIEF